MNHEKINKPKVGCILDRYDCYVEAENGYFFSLGSRDYFTFDDKRGRMVKVDEMYRGENMKDLNLEYTTEIMRRRMVTGMSVNTLTNGVYTEEEVLICMLNKVAALKERENSMKAVSTEDCSQACPVCKSPVNWKYCSNCGQRIGY